VSYLLYALAGILGFFLAATAVVVVAALYLVVRDEIRRRRETDLPPRIAELRKIFFREDIDRLRDVKLWFIWYEDRFDLENSLSFGITAHFSEESARAEFEKRGRPLAPGWDGFTIEGPADALTTPLFGEYRMEMLKVVLDRLKAGSTEPIPMRN
jgi:hypothetical protein